ncbi:PspC domain-containing protein [Altererythrobacter soli]|uniref:PspC domain-containing protein n=1 Tax=Croceibacterium soli TaxID=1739690 RepID=A0A6I4UUT2_9SPHN|nr:PspC domain-containing protein [Croceibacterium soli]MXP42541.1 PspC domain-containing protein [Croceibacterium soli]
MSALQHGNSGGAPAGFQLDKQNGKLMGVCAGLADYIGMSPLAWRLIFVAGTLIGFGSFILIYLAIGLLAD